MEESSPNRIPIRSTAKLIFKKVEPTNVMTVERYVKLNIIQVVLKHSKFLSSQVFKSYKAKEDHMATHHEMSFPEAESLIETRVQCTLCNMNDFTMVSIRDHLSNIHSIEEANNWEAYIGEVEFEMDVSENNVTT